MATNKPYLTLPEKWGGARATQASGGVRFDPGLLFTLAMCAFAVLPELAHPGLFIGHDTLNHAFRVGEVSRQWGYGILLPRWAETFYFGYGSPVFQYYTPLTYLLSALFMRLFGLDAIGALRLLVVICLPMAGAGMYLFMRDQAGRFGGMLAALVYVYSPYIVFTEPVTRGDYPELLCFALFPFVMWRLECLLKTECGRDMALAAVLIGIFGLAHNLMSVLLLGLLGGWLIWRKLFGTINWQQLRLGLLSALLGIGLAGFFWLPIFLEQNEVQLNNVPVNIQSEQANFFGFFVPLDHLLSPSALTDAGAANGVLLRLNLGIAQWWLALIGLVGFALIHIRTQRKDAKEQRRERIFSLLFTLYSSLIAFFTLCALLMLSLMLPIAAPLWTAIPVLNFLEFPWRLLGPIAFCLAVLAGMNAVWIKRLPPPAGSILTVILLIMPVALALPTLYVPENRLNNLDTSPAAYLQSEISGQTSPGTSARNDFLPKAVKVLPGATQSLLDDYADGEPVNKANPLSIPQGSSVTVLDHTPESETWQVKTAAPFTLETFTFDFAGWTANIDGQPAAINASKPHGFIQIPIPAGEHTVHLFLGETPARNAGIGVSIPAAVLIVGMVVVRSRRGVIYHAPTTPNLEGVGVIGLRPPVLFTIFVLTILIVGLFMREGIAWIQSPPGEARIAQHAVIYNLGDQIQVLGYDVSSENVRPGDWLEAVIYWYAKAQPDHNYNSFVHFAAGFMPLAQADKPLPAERLTRDWLPGAYRRDEYSLHIPDDVSPGEYNLNIGLYTCETLPAGDCGNGDRLPVTDANGDALGDILTLTAITVK